MRVLAFHYSTECGISVSQTLPNGDFAILKRFPQIGKWTPTYCMFILDTTIVPPENSITLFGCVRLEREGGNVRYLPGWTVQCINPECEARGHWLRADTAQGEHCSNCGQPLHNVPPPLSPQLRLRPRPLTTYRPSRHVR
jgi:hypothetical protein